MNVEHHEEESSPKKRGRGRPKSVSPALIQEAALELFQLQGYEGTSVDEIARAAGFSRATFFNYFGNKAEILWFETDKILNNLEERLHDISESESQKPLSAHLLSLADETTSQTIPWIFRHSDIISGRDDLIASGFSRIIRLNDMIRLYLAREQPEPEILLTHTYGYVAVILAALQNWVDDGVQRGSLSEYLQRSLSAHQLE